MDISSKIKQNVSTIKVLGLIISWNLLVILNDWVDWGNLGDPTFFSLIWLNGYTFLTICDAKKVGLAKFFSDIFNVIYDDTLDPRAKLNKAKEALGLAANFLSVKDLELVEQEKKLLEKSLEKNSDLF